MRLSAGTRLGPYEIVGLLGAGGMGEVYRARDPRLGREVAVKVLPAEVAGDPDRLRRFDHEARAAGSLNHPNILAVFDVGTHDRTPYVVSELLEGETLRDRIRVGVTGRKAIDYAVQIAQGLAAAHAKGIIHRDLKPENVFVTREGRVKILDFGLAKLRSPAEGGEGLSESTLSRTTEPGTVLGTIAYMSPEQVRGLPADRRSDIFSFGAVLYEMLSGQPAFRGATAADTMSDILRADPLTLTDRDEGAPRTLDRIVRRCLEKQPDERFQTAEDIAFALQAMSDTAGLALPRARRWSWFAALLLLAALASVGLLTRSRLSRRPPPAARIMLAVLPFENLSGDPEQEYLSDGFTEEMIVRLGRLHPERLAIIARTSAMKYKGTRKDVEEIGRELGVQYLLETAYEERSTLLCYLKMDPRFDGLHADLRFRDLLRRIGLAP